MLQPADRLIVALDVESQVKALRLVEQTRPYITTYKVGLELFTACGPALWKELKKQQVRLFLDLKLHDIPNTVARAVARACEQGVDMLTVHALGGKAMLEHALGQIKINKKSPLLLGVSLLTHHNTASLKDIGFQYTDPSFLVSHLVHLVYQAGLRGCVCSAQEAANIKALFPDMVVVCPGIRPLSMGKDDQFRIATPAQAVRNGADYIVVGRPISMANCPGTMAKSIVQEITEALDVQPSFAF